MIGRWATDCVARPDVLRTFAEVLVCVSVCVCTLRREANGAHASPRQILMPRHGTKRLPDASAPGDGGRRKRTRILARLAARAVPPEAEVTAAAAEDEEEEAEDKEEEAEDA